MTIGSGYPIPYKLSNAQYMNGQFATIYKYRYGYECMNMNRYEWIYATGKYVIRFCEHSELVNDKHDMNNTKCALGKYILPKSRSV